jgi:hypothetical protein
VVQFDGQHMTGADGQSFGDGAATGADFDHSAAGKIADGGRDALDGFRIFEKVLTEFWFGGHGLS